MDRAYVSAYGTKLNDMRLRFRVHMHVGTSQSGKYTTGKHRLMPGQTPGLVHNLGGPLVLTDRQNRRHSIWIY